MISRKYILNPALNVRRYVSLRIGVKIIYPHLAEPNQTKQPATAMNKATNILTTIALAFAFFGLTACDEDKVSEDAAKKAGETLKKWQDQNRRK